MSSFVHNGHKRSLGKWVDRLIRFDAQHASLKVAYKWLRSRECANRSELGNLLKGRGLEIGALNNPLRVSTEHCSVSYVDRFSNEQLRAVYPELNQASLVPVSILGRADHLPVPDCSQDFVIANHLIEHLDNPIAAIRDWHRIIKTGGFLFLAVPHYRGTFDVNRELTDLRHLFRDHLDAGQHSRFEHYLQWAEHVNGINGGIEKLQRARVLLEQEYPIHFHVWNELTFLTFFFAVQAVYGSRFAIEAHVSYNGVGDEFALLCRRL